MKKISVLILIMIPFISYSQEILLSDNAMKNYGIETFVTDNQTVTLPRSALVVSRSDYFIYLKKGDGFVEQQIYPTSVNKTSFTFKLDSMEKREFVTKGSPYLRIIILNGLEPAAE